jgi:hypothetical protein
MQNVVLKGSDFSTGLREGEAKAQGAPENPTRWSGGRGRGEL